MRLAKWLIGVAAMGMAMGIAPVAHADYTWTVQQLCSAKGDNLVPMPIFGSTDVTCADPAYWQRVGVPPGLFIAPPPSIPRMMADFRPGSYSTDPGNPWADWVVPDGSVPKVPPKLAVITETCDWVNGQVECGPA